MSSSYLDRIKFDKKLAESRVAKYLGNIRLVSLLILVIIFAGIIGYTSLPRRLNPEINLPIVSVVTLLPGASPTDVESLVTIPIEDPLRSVENLDTITSVSRENVSVITMQFTTNTNVDVAKSDVQEIVDSVTDLPDDAETPKVNALDFENQPVWTFALKSTTEDTSSLMHFAKTLQKDLENEKTVGTVSLSGWQEEEIQVSIKENAGGIGLTPFALSQSVKSALSSFPGGTFETAENAFSVTIDPTISSMDDLRNLPILINNTIVKLGDISEIQYAPKPNQGKALLSEKGKISQTVTFNVFKADSAKIDVAQKHAEELVEKKLKEVPGQFELVTISNIAEEITDQFNELLGEFGTTMLLVFGVILVFLGLRQATISIITVPLTFASAFFIMNQIGMSINFLSLFALLLTLGLLVDDTIVIISAMTSYYKTKKFTPYETGLLVWRDTIVPIWSTTITTIWSFVPLLLATGIIGAFIKPIPIVVSVTMISSTAIAVLVTLPIMIVLLKPQIARRVIIFGKALLVLAIALLFILFLQGNPALPAVIIAYVLFAGITLLVSSPLLKAVSEKIQKGGKKSPLVSLFGTISNKGLIDMHRLEKAYYNLTMRILGSKGGRRRATYAILIYSLLGFALIPLGFVKNEFFPKTPAEQLYVNLEMPPGTTSGITEREARELLTQLSLTEGVDEVSGTIGQSFSDTGEGTAGSNLATFTLRLPKIDDQKRDSITIAQELRDSFEGRTEGKVSVIELSGGPPAGADIQVTILGDDLGKIDEYAQLLASEIEKLQGVTNVESSLKKGTSTLVFQPDTAKLTELGVSLSDIGFAIRTYTSGFTLDTTTFGNSTNDELDIMFRLTDKADINDLNTITVQTQRGVIPLSTLGKFVPQTGLTTIVREEGKRRINVSAGVLPGYSATELNPKVVELAENLNLPEGYSWSTGGVNEENEESVQSIIYAMGAAALLILVTMVVQFNSFRQALVVLMVIPLAVSSVFWAFALTGIPLSFPALIGVLSLFGIVVTNSMFIVDKINLNRREGMPFKEAIADAGSSRLEPIILTKLCTVFGLLPITLADPLWRGLGGAIISGLLISSIIMLLFIPSVYYGWFKEKKN